MSEINRYGISGGAAVQVASGYFPEGQAPSTLNDASRTVMADVRRYIEQTTPETTATYSAGAYTLALTRDLSAGELTQGFTAAFIAGSTNSASATLNINSTGAKNLLDNAGTHIVGEAIQNHDPVNVVYDKKKDGYRVTDQLKAIAELSPAKLSGVDELSASAVYAANIITPQINGNQLGGRNYLINGDFAVAQRGATLASGSNADTDYTLDRWKLFSDTDDVVDVTQITSGVPTGNKYALDLDVETANKKFGVAQIIENVNCGDLIGQTVTLSFKAKVNATTNMDNVKAAIIAWSSTADSPTDDMISAWGAEGTAPTLASNFTYEGSTPADLNVTTSWADYSVSAAVDTSSCTNVIVFIWSDVTTTTAGTDHLYLANVQLELGSHASNFQTEGYGENLARCQRYYNKMIVGDNGYFYSPAIHSGTYRRSSFNFPVPMRSETITTAQSGIAGHTGTPSAVAYSNGVQWQMNVSAAGNLSYFGTDGYITNDAEI